MNPQRKSTIFKADNNQSQIQDPQTQKKQFRREANRQTHRFSPVEFEAMTEDKDYIFRNQLKINSKIMIKPKIKTKCEITIKSSFFPQEATDQQVYYPQCGFHKVNKKCRICSSLKNYVSHTQKNQEFNYLRFNQIQTEKKPGQIRKNFMKHYATQNSIYPFQYSTPSKMHFHYQPIVSPTVEYQKGNERESKKFDRLNSQKHYRDKTLGLSVPLNVYGNKRYIQKNDLSYESQQKNKENRYVDKQVYRKCANHSKTFQKSCK